jgi:nicotinamide-nucleotide amidase
MTALNVQLLMTGNEVMAGDTIDSNSAYIARELAAMGIKVSRRVTVNDDLEQLLIELNSMSASADIVIMNGGLGPTVDDLTSEALAAFSDSALQIHPHAKAQLEAWCDRRGQALNDANKKQMLIPSGADIIPNATGSAPGIDLQHNGTRVFATPGVPSEMRQMLPIIMDRISARFDLTHRTIVRRLQTFGLGESNAQQLINNSTFDWPATVELGFRASAPQMEVKLTIHDDSHREDQERCIQHIHTLFGDHIVGEGDTTLAEAVLTLLRERQQTITTAESCTGGLIASALTQIPGASAAFHAGFVTYDNAIKASVLGVSDSHLNNCGAVSEPVVRQMAEGALARASADYVIAVSGVAGPDGGSDEKPVGTVWVAYGSREALNTLRLLWPLPRQLFQTMVTACTLDLIRRQLLGLPKYCRYVDQRQVVPSDQE